MEAYENKEANPVESAQKTFYDRVKGMLSRLLQSWSPPTGRACLAVAQGQNDSGFNRELWELQKQGFVKKDENGQWQIRAKVFSEWLKENQDQLPCSEAPPN